MLVKDLKKVLEKYDDKEKEKIIIELYKRIPKKVKENYNIDEYLENIKINEKTEVKKLDFSTLHNEVNYFLECAYANLYCTPNRIVSKSDRSKWRFKVKRFYKELNSFLPGTVEGEIATDLLKELFRLLSLGTHILKFSNWETFKAIGVAQGDFYECIIKRKLVTGYSEENLKYCIDLLNVESDPYDYGMNIFYIFISSLKTVDIKVLAINLLDEKVKEIKEKLKSKDDYYTSVRMNNYIESVVDIYFGLCEIDDAIKYFHKNYYERDKEVKEYILLRMLDEFEFYDEWIKEYEKYLEKIEYRDSLVKRYNELKTREM